MSNVTLIVLGLGLTLIAAGAVSFSLAAIDRIQFLKEELEKAKARGKDYKTEILRRQEEVKFWNDKAYEQNQKFLLACRHLTLEQVEQIEKDIQSL